MLKMEVKTLNESFYHYGVKGMKWGVRKEVESPYQARQKNMESVKAQRKVESAAKERAQNVINSRKDESFEKGRYSALEYEYSDRNPSKVRSLSTGSNDYLAYRDSKLSQKELKAEENLSYNTFLKIGEASIINKGVTPNSQITRSVEANRDNKNLGQNMYAVSVYDPELDDEYTVAFENEEEAEKFEKEAKGAQKELQEIQSQLAAGKKEIDSFIAANKNKPVPKDISLTRKASDLVNKAVKTLESTVSKVADSVKDVFDKLTKKK